MMNSQILYRTLSTYGLVKNILIRIVAFAISIYSFAHFEENPVVTTIFGCIFFFLCLFIGNHEFILYSDRVKYSSDSILGKYGHKKKLFYLSEIAKVEVSGNFGLAIDVATDIGNPLFAPWNSISFILKDGTKKEFATKVYIDKLQKLKELIYQSIAKYHRSSEQ